MKGTMLVKVMKRKEKKDECKNGKISWKWEGYLLAIYKDKESSIV